MEERTGWQGQNESQTGGEEKKNGTLVGAAETSKERAEWRRLERKNLNILGLPRRKEWPQCHKESSWQERRSRPCQKKKEQSRLSRVPDHEGGESHGALHGERRQVPKRRGRASKKSFPRTSRRMHERVSGCKTSPGRPAVSWFHS